MAGDAGFGRACLVVVRRGRRVRVGLGLSSCVSAGGVRCIVFSLVSVWLIEAGKSVCCLVRNGVAGLDRAGMSRHGRLSQGLLS